MALELNTIHLGDCLDLMSDIPDGSVDMILADLPYGTTACDWDSVIPLEPLWAHYKRVIKPRGAIVLTGSQPFTSMLVMSNLEWFKYEWIWEKDRASNFMAAKHTPLKYHEQVLVFCEGVLLYSPKMVNSGRVSNQRGKVNKTKPGGVYGHLKEKRGYKLGTLRYPSTILRFNTPKQNDTVNGCLHPTQKPVALFAYLIRTYTHPGDLVLDNVAGSGTTGVACLNEGREFILIEKDEEYFKMATARIQQRTIELGQMSTEEIRALRDTTGISKPGYQLGLPL